LLKNGFENQNLTGLQDCFLKVYGPVVLQPAESLFPPKILIFRINFNSAEASSDPSETCASRPPRVVMDGMIIPNIDVCLLG